MKIVPVILSGGSGTRLWPASRAQHPKQLIALVGTESLLQQTVRRAQDVAGESHMIVVCNHNHRFQVADQLNSVGLSDASIVLEPCGRNTAPAIAVAAMQTLTAGDDAVMLVLPSDHLIEHHEPFAQAVHAGLPHAQGGALITFGIKPVKPATGYGYIRAEGDGIVPVAQFTEKPSRDLAEQYLSAGNYFWNSGMFMFRPDVYLDALNEFESEMLSTCEKAFEAMERDSDFLRIPETVFSSCPSRSIDYAVMEKTTKATLVPLDAGWSDLGSWESLWEVGRKSPQGNVVSGDVLVHNVKDCYIRAESRLVTALGLENLVVVETPDAVLVMQRERGEDIKQLIEQLEIQQRPERIANARAQFAWGSEERIIEDEGFILRRLSVRPGAVSDVPACAACTKLLLVPSGPARLEFNDECFELEAHKAANVPVWSAYRLENTGLHMLEVLEICIV